jgi:hypothetical protein
MSVKSAAPNQLTPGGPHPLDPSNQDSTGSRDQKRAPSRSRWWQSTPWLPPKGGSTPYLRREPKATTMPPTRKQDGVNSPLSPPPTSEDTAREYTPMSQPHKTAVPQSPQEEGALSSQRKSDGGLVAPRTPLDGEGCERFWSSIKLLIPAMRVSGYYQ